MLNDRRLQLSLPIAPTKARTPSPPAPKSQISADARPPVPGVDQVLSSRDIARITGRHRCTIYRWVRAGVFPPKRAGGGRGWLRSDVEHWLAGGSVAPHEFAVTRRP